MEIKNFILDLLFPKFCLGCQREGSYLCEDCKATLEISETHQKYKTKYLSDLYHPSSYQKSLIKNLIRSFKYEPFVKELAKPLSSLIIDHFQLIDHPPPFFGGGPNFEDYILISVPLEKRKLKRRGFNQAEELGKELAKYFKIPLISDCLIKIKETQPQMDLSEEERRENIKGVFFIKNREKIRERKILLIDDVYTTGSTMTECAQILKGAGAKEVIGIVVARASPTDDRLII